jgi:hypothetical protein
MPKRPHILRLSYRVTDYVETPFMVRLSSSKMEVRCEAVEGLLLSFSHGLAKARDLNGDSRLRLSEL